NFFPIKEIIKPEIGKNMNTKIVSLGLITIIAIMVNNMVSGSRTISSRIDRKENCTSLTSAVILEMVSPFFFSEKYEMGSERIFEYRESLRSFKTPLRRKVIKYAAR